MTLQNIMNCEEMLLGNYNPNILLRISNPNVPVNAPKAMNVCRGKSREGSVV